MIVLLVLVVVAGFVVASTLFGADSRSFDARRNLPDWPAARHGS